MKRNLIILAVALSPLCVFAAPQITFQGEVSNQTCVAEVNGQTNAIVLLPTVAASTLANPGDTAGLTPFTLSLRNCTAKASDVNITTHFLGHAVTADGNLGNLAVTNPAQFVQMQLLNKATGGTQVILSGTTAVTGLVLKANETSASYDFGVQYISEEGGATPGPVQAIAEYSISYP